MEFMLNIKDLADYIITKLCEGGEELNNLKLQKLAFYCDAWYLAFFGKKLVDTDFQAWIHGPVSRELYDRFSATKSLYSSIAIEDRSPDYQMNLSINDAAHLDSVLEAYGKFSGAQLEEMTHREEPWIRARKGYRPSQRCEEVLDSAVTRDYYKSRLSQA